MRRILLALLVSAVSVPTNAEFTDAEKIQVLKIVTAHNQATSAIASAASLLQNETSAATKGNIACTIEGTANALRHLIVVFGWLTKSPIQQQPFPDDFTRAEQIAFAQNQMGQTLGGLGATKLCADMLSSSTPGNVLGNSIATLQSFNWQLSYTEPRLAEYPAFIGPHGSYDVATAAQFHLQRYQLRTIARVARIYEGSPHVSPHTTLQTYSAVLFANERIIRRAMRAWALDVAIEPAQEAAVVDHLFANCQVTSPDGQCHRPRSFWRALVAFEIFTAFPGYNNTIPADHMNTDHTGRPWMSASAVGQFFSIGNRLPVLAAQGDLAWSTNEDERLVLGDLMDSWKDMDVYLGALFLFFVDAPAPPPGNGGGQGGGECPECQGCPECPPPVECPVLVPQLVLLGNSLEARCVEQ